jgi:hypothetical protein
MYLQMISRLTKFLFPALNILLVLIIAALVTFGTRTWVIPTYPDKVDIDRVAYVPKTLEPLAINGKVNHAKAINTVVQGNLFRKDRIEFSPPVQVRKVVHEPVSPTLPPPDLMLKGVLLSGSKKIAFIEGSYFVKEGIHGVKKKLLNRKGYPLGAKIGSFELTEIEKTKVILHNNKRVVLIVNLMQRPKEKIIHRFGNTLVQKDKNFDPESIKKVSPPLPSTQTTLKQSSPARSKNQPSQSKGFWTRFKREEGQTKQE